MAGVVRKRSEFDAVSSLESLPSTRRACPELFLREEPHSHEESSSLSARSVAVVSAPLETGGAFSQEAIARQAARVNHEYRIDILVREIEDAVIAGTATAFPESIVDSILKALVSFLQETSSCDYRKNIKLGEVAVLLCRIHGRDGTSFRTFSRGLTGFCSAGSQVRSLLARGLEEDDASKAFLCYVEICKELGIPIPQTFADQFLSAAIACYHDRDYEAARRYLTCILEVNFSSQSQFAEASLLMSVLLPPTEDAYIYARKAIDLLARLPPQERAVCRMCWPLAYLTALQKAVALGRHSECNDIFAILKAQLERGGLPTELAACAEIEEHFIRLCIQEKQWRRVAEHFRILLTMSDLSTIILSKQQAYVQIAPFLHQEDVMALFMEVGTLDALKTYFSECCIEEIRLFSSLVKSSDVKGAHSLVQLTKSRLVLLGTPSHLLASLQDLAKDHFHSICLRALSFFIDRGLLNDAEYCSASLEVECSFTNPSWKYLFEGYKTRLSDLRKLVDQTADMPRESSIFKAKDFFPFILLNDFSRLRVYRDLLHNSPDRLISAHFGRKFFSLMLEVDRSVAGEFKEGAVL